MRKHQFESILLFSSAAGIGSSTGAGTLFAAISRTTWPVLTGRPKSRGSSTPAPSFCFFEVGPKIIVELSSTFLLSKSSPTQQLQNSFLSLPLLQRLHSQCTINHLTAHSIPTIDIMTLSPFLLLAYCWLFSHHCNVLVAIVLMHQQFVSQQVRKNNNKSAYFFYSTIILAKLSWH